MVSRGDMRSPEKGEVNDTLGFCGGTAVEGAFDIRVEVDGRNVEITGRGE